MKKEAIVNRSISRFVLLAFLFLGCASMPRATEGPSFDVQRGAEPPEARLVATESGARIQGRLVDLQKAITPDLGLLISVELPKTAADATVVAALRATESGSWTEIEGFAEAVQRLEVTFPPGPDDGTIWRSFLLSSHEAIALAKHEAEFRFDIRDLRGVDFTRILIGRPSTPGSQLVGAFPDSPTAGKGSRIRMGVDYLGTERALQHIRIPANTLAPGTQAFDAMVDFVEAPFDPKRSNIDTIMVRSRDIRVGETVPVRLVRFANKTREPLRIRGPEGELYFEVTATLSPNAYSGGFVSILPDGTYESSTSLTPVFHFQQLIDGQPVGEPRDIDTADIPVPGFPFYLASQGGRWSEEPPAGRLVTRQNSNFFYDNGTVNDFLHSNGVQPGVLAACKKASSAAAVF